MKCESCVEVKDKPMTYTRCRVCGNWRLMSEVEIATAKKPFRFSKEIGTPTRNY